MVRKGAQIWHNLIMKSKIRVHLYSAVLAAFDFYCDSIENYLNCHLIYLIAKIF